jgi:hypothetical protein
MLLVIMQCHYDECCILFIVMLSVLDMGKLELHF